VNKQKNHYKCGQTLVSKMNGSYFMVEYLKGNLVCCKQKGTNVYNWLNFKEVSKIFSLKGSEIKQKKAYKPWDYEKNLVKLLENSKPGKQQILITKSNGYRYSAGVDLSFCKYLSKNGLLFVVGSEGRYGECTGPQKFYIGKG